MPHHSQGQVITTIFGVLIGAMSLGQMAPGMTALGEAKQAGYKVFQTLDRVPPIDASSTEGSKPESVEGRLEFQQVCGMYIHTPWYAFIFKYILNRYSIYMLRARHVRFRGPSLRVWTGAWSSNRGWHVCTYTMVCIYMHFVNKVYASRPVSKI